MSKDEIIKFIERLPANATESDVMEELYFRVQVDKGLEDVESGRVITSSDLRNRIAEWRRSAGR